MHRSPTDYWGAGSSFARPFFEKTVETLEAERARLDGSQYRESLEAERAKKERKKQDEKELIRGLSILIRGLGMDLE